MIKEKYNQLRLSYQIGRIRTIGYIQKFCFMQNKTPMRVKITLRIQTRVNHCYICPYSINECKNYFSIRDDKF